MTAHPTPPYEQLATLDPADPVLHRLLCPPPALPGDRAWLPPAVPPAHPVSHGDMFKLIAGAVAAGAPAPLALVFNDDRQLVIQMADNDRRGTTLMAALFGLGRPDLDAIRALAPQHQDSQPFGASHARTAADPDDHAVAPDFGGWRVTVFTCVTAGAGS